MLFVRKVFGYRLNLIDSLHSHCGMLPIWLMELWGYLIHHVRNCYKFAKHILIILLFAIVSYPYLKQNVIWGCLWKKEKIFYRYYIIGDVFFGIFIYYFYKFYGVSTKWECKTLLIWENLNENILMDKTIFEYVSDSNSYWLFYCVKWQSWF